MSTIPQPTAENNRGAHRNSLFEKTLPVTLVNRRLCGHKLGYLTSNSHRLNTLRKKVQTFFSRSTRQGATMSTPKTSTTDLNAFAWTYAQQSGHLEQDGRPVATGYSGANQGKNNPALQNV